MTLTAVPEDSHRTIVTGILCALGGSATLSVNDVAIKSLSGTYALHQVILIRALIGLVFLTLLVIATGKGFRQFRTRRPRDHAIRVSIVLVSNASYFLALAAMPLAEAVAIAFIAPLLITALSVVFLREYVGPRRWAAVAVGLAGVVVMLRPGSGVFNPAALLVLLSAFCYASSHMMTRRMRATESAITLNFHVQVGFVALSTVMGLVVGDGHLAGSSNASLAFLFREWVWPPAADWPAFLATGLAVTVGGLLISQAYRLCEAALVAPFEYAAMPFAIFWGIIVFGQWPDTIALFGIALICGAGLYALRRERVRKLEGQG